MHLAVGGLHHRAVGHPQDQVAAVGAVAVVAGAALAVLGLDVRAEVEVEQRVHARVDDQHDAAAVAAVAAVGAAQRLELLPEDRHTAVPAVAGLHVQHDPVDERRHGVILSHGHAKRQRRAADTERVRGPL